MKTHVTLGSALLAAALVTAALPARADDICYKLVQPRPPTFKETIICKAWDDPWFCFGFPHCCAPGACEFDPVCHFVINEIVDDGTTECGFDSVEDAWDAFWNGTIHLTSPGNVLLPFFHTVRELSSEIPPEWAAFVKGVRDARLRDWVSRHGTRGWLSDALIENMRVIGHDDANVAPAGWVISDSNRGVTLDRDLIVMAQGPADRILDGPPPNLQEFLCSDIPQGPLDDAALLLIHEMTHALQYVERGRENMWLEVAVDGFEGPTEAEAEEVVRIVTDGSEDCFFTRQNDLNLDGDGFDERLDNCPAHACLRRGIDVRLCNNPAQVDGDGDGVGDTCDSCPEIGNHDQLADADGDFVGNLCDPCGATTIARKSCTSNAQCAGRCILAGGIGLCTPHPAELGDPDVDGICDPRDNCPWVKNPGQENVNALAESFHSPARVWGDACDPAPAPAALFESGEIISDSSGCGAGLCIYTTKADASRFRISPLASNAYGPSPSTTIRTSVPTHFRFCKLPEFDLDPACDDRNAVADIRLVDAATAEQEQARQPYHRISVAPRGIVSSAGTRAIFATGSAGLAGRVNTAIALDQTRFQTLVENYPRTTRAAVFRLDYRNPNTLNPAIEYGFQWYYEQDYWFWKSRGNSVVDLTGYQNMADLRADAYTTSPIPVGPERLKGILWSHAETTAGQTEHGPNLSNTHTKMSAVGYSASVREQRPPNIKEIVVWPGPDPINPVYTDRYRATLIYGSSGGLTTLDPVTGGGRVVADMISPDLQEDLINVGSSPGNRHWVSQAEPVGYARDNPRVAVMIEGYGTRVANFAVDFGPALLGFASAVQLVALVSTPDDLTGSEEASAQSQTAAALSGNLLRLGAELRDSQLRVLPEGRVGYRAVYSRSLDRLFILGGIGRDGQAVSRVWAGRPGNMLSQLPVDSGLHDVISATYEPVTGKLYALDGVEAPWGRNIRFVRIDPASGASTLLFEWPDLARFPERHIVADNGGRLIITGSTPTGLLSSHVMAKIDARLLRVDALVTRGGALPVPPVVVADGYQRIFIDPFTGAPRVVAEASLGGTLASPLAALLNIVGQCF